MDYRRSRQKFSAEVRVLRLRLNATVIDHNPHSSRIHIYLILQTRDWSFGRTLRLCCALLFVLAASVRAASFDCTKAKTQNEKLICSNETLSILDAELNAQYQKLLKAYERNQAIRQWQINWLKSNELKCQTPLCLENAYKKQIATLQSANRAEHGTRGFTGRYVRVLNGKKDSNQADLLLIGLSDSRVLISGTALWISPSNPSSVHTGEINGRGILRGGIIASADKAELCSANFQLIESGSLRVEYESGCGGLNVTFNGLYKRW